MTRDRLIYTPVAARPVARWGEQEAAQLGADLVSVLIAHLQQQGVQIDSLTPQDLCRALAALIQ